MVDCYDDADFAGLWRHKNSQDPICDRSRTGFVANFSNFSLLWVSKLQTEIALSKLNFKYVALYNSIKSLVPLKLLSRK